LDDPGSTTISAFNNPTAPALVPASAPENVPTGDAFPGLAGGLVTGVVALTAALIRILHRKPPKAGMEPEDAGSAPQESLERKNS
ncbi:MAG: hypothetical protein LBR72_09010, partial [Oscillospiraceae bacterium]|nr:hypothetical protein [Oscillospiraceae bacterium]